jgi:hypothetical protein
MPQQLTDAVDPVNLLYYGDGGTGKTSHICAMARLGKVWILNAEGGIKKRPLALLGIPIENIEVFPGPDEVLDYESVEAEWIRIREAVAADPTSYVGVGIDSLTDFQMTLAGKVASAAVIRASRAGRDRNPSVMDQDNWREVNWYVNETMRRFRDLPVHFAMSALTRREQDDDSSITYRPAVTPSLQNPLDLTADVICHTSVALVDGEEEFRGLFRPHGKYRGKDRLHALPKWLVDPTFDRVVGYVNDELTVDTDDVMNAARVRAQREKELQAETENTKQAA